MINKQIDKTDHMILMLFLQNEFYKWILSIKLCRPILIESVLLTYCEFSSTKKVEETFA